MGLSWCVIERDSPIQYCFTRVAARNRPEFFNPRSTGVYGADADGRLVGYRPFDTPQSEGATRWARNLVLRATVRPSEAVLLPGSAPIT